MASNVYQFPSTDLLAGIGMADPVQPSATVMTPTPTLAGAVPVAPAGSSSAHRGGAGRRPLSPVGMALGGAVAGAVGSAFLGWSPWLGGAVGGAAAFGWGKYDEAARDRQRRREQKAAETTPEVTGG